MYQAHCWSQSLQAAEWRGRDCGQRRRRQLENGGKDGIRFAHVSDVLESCGQVNVLENQGRIDKFHRLKWERQPRLLDVKGVQLQAGKCLGEAFCGLRDVERVDVNPDNALA